MSLILISEKISWITVDSDEVKMWLDIVCQPNVVTHAIDTDKNILFLVLVNKKGKSETKDSDRELRFHVANQRDKLSGHYKMVAMNNTIEVAVMLRHVNHAQNEVENLNLMMWLYRR